MLREKHSKFEVQIFSFLVNSIKDAFVQEINLSQLEIGYTDKLKEALIYHLKIWRLLTEQVEHLFLWLIWFFILVIFQKF